MDNILEIEVPAVSDYIDNLNLIRERLHLNIQSQSLALMKSNLLQAKLDLGKNIEPERQIQEVVTSPNEEFKADEQKYLPKIKRENILAILLQEVIPVEQPIINIDYPIDSFLIEKAMTKISALKMKIQDERFQIERYDDSKLFETKVRQNVDGYLSKMSRVAFIRC